MEKSKGLELAKKLLALKQRGFGGEAENAAKMLAHILKKYDLTEEEIESERLDPYFFKVFRKGTEKRKLAFQIIVSVLGMDIKYANHRTDSSKIMLEISRSQYIELTEKLGAYINAYEKHMKEMQDTQTYAFIIANNIYPAQPEKTPEEVLEEASNKKAPTAEEMEQHMKAKRAAGEIEPTIINKLLK